jgi:hypothetical protein
MMYGWCGGASVKRGQIESKLKTDVNQTEHDWTDENVKWVGRKRKATDQTKETLAPLLLGIDRYRYRYGGCVEKNGSLFV